MVNYGILRLLMENFFKLPFLHTANDGNIRYEKRGKWIISPN